jgi:undecaprenyl-diphosphatase
MSILQALILGLIQGATEFIPVSSSGHLVLVPWLLGWEPPLLAFDTMVHWGTLVAVLAVFWRDLWALVVAAVNSLLALFAQDRPYDRTRARLAWAIALGTIPAALAGFFLEDFFENLFGLPVAAAGLLLLTAAILTLSEWLSRQRFSMTGIGWVDALLIGVAQAFAIMPGISRSGATIAAGLGRGVQREAAARFSFLLGTPIIFGAGLLQLAELAETGGLGEILGLLIIGFAVAAVTGYVCIRWLLRYLAHHPLYIFAVYCFLFGCLNLGLAVVRGA